MKHKCPKCGSEYWWENSMIAHLKQKHKIVLKKKLGTRK